MFTLTTAQGLWMRIFAKRVVKPNHVFSNFFFYFSRKVKALVQRIVHKLNGFFLGGGWLLFYGHYHSMLKVAT